jgi:hypothetical protein
MNKRKTNALAIEDFKKTTMLLLGFFIKNISFIPGNLFWEIKEIWKMLKMFFRML